MFITVIEGKQMHTRHDKVAILLTHCPEMLEIRISRPIMKSVYKYKELPALEVDKIRTRRQCLDVFPTYCSTIWLLRDVLSKTSELECEREVSDYIGLR